MRPPRLAVPELARTACALATLPADAVVTWADLEAAYLLRGRQLVECELARRLAIDTLEAERAAQDAAAP